MRKVRRYVWMALMSASLVAAQVAEAQTAHRTTGNNTTVTSRSSRGNNNNAGATRSQAVTNNSRPGGGGTTTLRQNNGGNNSRPGGGGTTTSRPNNGGNNSRPGGGGTTTSRPNNGGNNSRPGGGNNNNNIGNNNRPNNGGNHNNGGNNFRPGGGNNNPHPGGGNSGHNPGSSLPRPGVNGGNNVHPGNSLPRPGIGGAPASRPTPPPPPAYRPPVAYRWERPLPPPPPRYQYVRVGVPTIGSILGLTFGTLIDYGVASLINAGYNVSSTYGNNTIYLSNVAQFGVTWPEATLFYQNGGLSGARFQYGSYSPTDYRFNVAYSQLCSSFGNPIEMVYNNGWPVATWWGGNNTGYITLQFGPGVTNTGSTMYYTDLIYGM